MLIGNILLDLIVAFAIVSGFYIGWRRGFISVVLKNFAGLFSAVLSFRCFEGFAAVLKEKYVHAFVKDGLADALSGLTDGASAENMADAVPASLARIAGFVGIDLLEMAEKAAESGKNAIESFVTSASNSISQLLSSIVSFAILFALFLFVLRVLSVPLSAVIMKTPLIGSANRMLGLLFGAFATLILTWVAVQLIGFLDATIGLGFLEVKDCALSGMFYRFRIFS